MARSDRRTQSRLNASALSAVVFLNSTTGKTEKVGCTVEDLCYDGIRISADERLPIGAHIEIRILSEGTKYPIKFSGAIVWRRPLKNGFAHGISRTVSSTSENFQILDAMSSLRRRRKVFDLLARAYDSIYSKAIGTAIRSSFLGSMALSGRSDTGEVFEHLYKNVPKGEGRFGRWVDSILLSLPAAKASRNRKAKIEVILREEILRNSDSNLPTRILDIGSGESGYIREAAVDSQSVVEALCLDMDQETIRHARRHASITMRHVRANAFKLSHLEQLGQRVGWRPNVVVLSGFIYYYSDLEVQQLFRALHRISAPGALIIVSNLIGNPNARLIRKVFKTKSGAGWAPIWRDSATVYRLLEANGFSHVKHSADKWNMYSVFCGRANGREPNVLSGRRLTEVRANGVTFRLNYVKATHGDGDKGTVLFVHGLGYSHDAYPINISLFTDAGFNFAGVNLRGHAGTDGDWTLEDSIADIAAISSHLRGNVYVLAHSTGALIATLASLRKEANISALVMVSPVTSVLDSFLHWHQSGFNQTVKPFFAEKGEIPSVISEYLDRRETIFEFKNGSRPKAELAFPFRYGMLRSNNFKNLSDAIMYSPNIIDVGSKIRVPCLIFRGAYDEVIPVEKIESFYENIHGEKRLQHTPAREHFHREAWPAMQTEIMSFLDGLQSGKARFTAA